MKDFRKSIGDSGEETAMDFLLSKGLILLDKNYTVWGGQIDLIFEDNDEIVFVEVKTRKSTSVSEEQWITRKQQRTLERTATQWLKIKGKLEEDFRFDLIVVNYKDNEFTVGEWMKDLIFD